MMLSIGESGDEVLVAILTDIDEEVEGLALGGNVVILYI